MITSEVTPTETDIMVERKAKAKMLWTERDGTITPIPCMGDRHLSFAIRMIEEGLTRNPKRFWRTDQLSRLKEEQRYRRALIEREQKQIREELKRRAKDNQNRKAPTDKRVDGRNE